MLSINVKLDIQDVVDLIEAYYKSKYHDCEINKITITSFNTVILVCEDGKAYFPGMRECSRRLYPEHRKLKD